MDNNKNDENLGSFYMGRLRKSPGSGRRMPPGLLTAVALFALVGIVWYAYPRGAEKYTEMDVPVVKADAGPIKEEPVDPGGMEVRHQDSTVFEPLQPAAGSETATLSPAPEEPMDKEAAIKSEEGVALPAVAGKMAPQMNLDLQMKDAGGGTEKVVSADDVAADLRAIASEKVEMTSAPEKAEASPVAKKLSAKKETAKTATAKTETPATGSRYIQLGSYRSIADAKKDWDRLKRKETVLSKLTMKTAKVDLPGKGIYYRLQAGKLTAERAAEVCNALKKNNSGGCIVVK